MKLVGLDTGKHTGVAIWDTEKRAFDTIATLPIHEALLLVWSYRGNYHADRVEVYFEDARQRTWFPKMTAAKDRARLQGAGSVKRDSTIWEDALTDWGIPFHAIAPKNNVTKMTAEYFRKITGWQGKTSEHARDAAMLVFAR